MKFTAVTIKDIAKALGLSASTVSRALRDSHEISAETKQLVMECAEKLKYSPNPAALSLKERKTKSIGVIVCELANSFFSQVINGIESVAYSKGYNVIITQSLESYDRELNNLNSLSSRSIDGLLISLSSETTDLSYLFELQQKGMPIVYFDRVVNEINSHCVVIDNVKGAYDATEHLIKNGYKRIAMIASSEFLSITKERITGYREALRSNNIAVEDSYIKYCFYNGMIFQELEEAINDLMELKEKPDAIFAASDKLTTGCLKIFNKRGLKTPADMGLAGFCNSELAELIYSPLTVVQQPAFEMGKLSCELLLQLIESKQPVSHFEKRVLKAGLIARESSALRK